MKATDLELVHLDTRPQPIPRAVEAESVAVIGMVPRLAGLKTILVPIDFSTVSEKAIIYAAAFARQFDAKITLLHVVDFLYAIDVQFAAEFESDQARIGANAKARLDMIAASKVPADIRAQAEVRWGTPWHVIGASFTRIW